MILSRIIVLTFIMLAMPVTVKGSTILVMGDSISAAYGIELEQGWVKLLQNKLDQDHSEKKSWEIINASISGETTAGALARLPGLLEKYKPQLCIIELGANDGLRGMPVNKIQENLNSLIFLCKQYGQVLLLGMQLPPNYGIQYNDSFKRSFEQVAKKNKIAFVPFLLKGFADDEKYFLDDRFHPNTEAQEKILANVWPILFLLLLQ